jgi:hypothetical protein
VVSYNNILMGACLYLYAGRIYGVATPVNDLMQSEARKAAVAGAGVGAVPASELMAKL